MARWKLYEDRPQLASRGVDIIKYRGEVLAIFGLGWSVGLLILSNKITQRGYGFLSRNTDEIVYYCEELDIYLWSITHFGTSWDYVLTNIKLKEMMQL